jgi:hypothetical protein
MADPTGYVYIYGGNGLYKIGRAKNVEKRIRSFPQPPFPATVVRAIPTARPAVLERRIHRHFRQQRRNGEWFKLSNTDLAFLQVATEDDFLLSPEPAAALELERMVGVRFNLFTLQKQLELRRGEPVTQEQIAYGANLHLSTVYGLFKNTSKRVDLRTVEKLVDYFNREGLTITAGDLFTTEFRESTPATNS